MQDFPGNTSLDYTVCDLQYVYFTAPRPAALANIAQIWDCILLYFTYCSDLLHTGSLLLLQEPASLIMETKDF